MNGQYNHNLTIHIMNRFFLYSAMVCMATMFVSCSSEEDEGSKKWPSAITLQVGETFSLAGANSYVSSNEFVLQVDERFLTKNEITAYHVGRSTLTVTDKDGEHIIDVTVKGRYNSYPDPVTEWMITPAQVKERYQVGVVPEEEEPSENVPVYTLIYRSVGKAHSIAYVFSDNKLMSVAVYVPKAIWHGEIDSYLRERFHMAYDGRNSAYAMAGTNSWTARIGSSVDYNKYTNEWLDVYTNKPGDVFVGGDYTVAFTSRYYPEDNMVGILYFPNFLNK